MHHVIIQVVYFPRKVDCYINELPFEAALQNESGVVIGTQSIFFNFYKSYRNQILTIERQTMLFSATQTTKVEDLARVSLKAPLYINVDERKEIATADGLEQGYVVCDSDQRFLLLFTFLKRNLKKKVIIFMSSCNSVKYHAELLNYIDIPVLDLHVFIF